LIEVVDPEQQYHHLSTVLELHSTLYSQPFILPSTNLPNPMAITQVDEDTTFGTLDSTMPSSEITSEISLNSEQVKVSPPSPSSLISSLLLSTSHINTSQSPHEPHIKGTKLTSSYAIPPNSVLPNLQIGHSGSTSLITCPRKQLGKWRNYQKGNWRWL
jgi:hypothetical protein